MQSMSRSWDFDPAFWLLDCGIWGNVTGQIKLSTACIMYCTFGFFFSVSFLSEDDLLFLYCCFAGLVIVLLFVGYKMTAALRNQMALYLIHSVVTLVTLCSNTRSSEIMNPDDVIIQLHLVCLLLSQPGLFSYMTACPINKKRGFQVDISFSSRTLFWAQKPCDIGSWWG